MNLIERIKEFNIPAQVIDVKKYNCLVKIPHSVALGNKNTSIDAQYSVFMGFLLTCHNDVWNSICKEIESK